MKWDLPCLWVEGVCVEVKETEGERPCLWVKEVKYCLWVEGERVWVEGVCVEVKETEGERKARALAMSRDLILMSRWRR